MLKYYCVHVINNNIIKNQVESCKALLEVIWSNLLTRKTLTKFFLEHISRQCSSFKFLNIAPEY